MLIQDNEAFLKKIPKLDADGQDRYSGIILEGRPGIGKTSFASSIFPDVPRSRIVRVPMATRTYEEFGAYPFPIKEAIDAYKFDEEGNVLRDDNGEKMTEKKEFVRVEQALSEVSIEPLLEENIGDDYGILLFDDVTLSDPRVQNSLLEIVQYGVIANRRIGKNVVIFLTGNKTDDGAYAVEWSTPLVGRCVKISVEPNLDLWLTYPDNQDVCPTVVGFLKEHGNIWFAPASGDEKTTDDSGRTPAPRDWTRLGRAMYQQGGYRNFEPDFIFTSPQVYAHSMVGELAATAYTQYANNFGVYPTAEELFEDPDVWNDVPNEQKELFSGCLAVIFGVRNYATRKMEQLLSSEAELFEITNKLFDITLMIANNNRELVGFIMSGLKTWADKDKKARKNVMLVTAKVITQPKYAQNEEFKQFISALWKYSNKNTANK
ncbi:MAG: hypothetical protein CMN72_00105 [Sphingomonas sp.]|nr:hypothetical protein [Sphingomonas sp.]|tara:strand:+ start:194 stop:1492 length:1299 start_codon:yes stop_codon:yes gene_type:complete